MNRCSRVTRLGALLLFAALGFAGHGHAQSVSRDSASKRLAKGKELFEGRGLCLSCHGKSGEGLQGVGPSLRKGPFVHTKGTLPEIVALITTGIYSAHSKSGLVMAPKGGSRMTATEVELVAEYVLTFRKGGQN